MIYLDANATTPLDPAVMAAMKPALAEVFANPSSVHKPGQDARALVDRGREQCGTALDCDAREIVFTSGGTEADALAVRGLGRRKVVTTSVEHPALLGACAELERGGVEVVRVPVDRSGQLDLGALEKAIRPDTAIVTAMWANNETGVIFPVHDIAEIVRAKRTLFHTDAVQAVGKMPLRIRELPIDLLSCSAHKLGGPKGAGLLWARRGIPLAPVQVGGHQERGRRAGTENVAAIVGLGEALSRAVAAIPSQAPRLAALRDRLEVAAREIRGAHVAGAGTPRVCNTLNVAFEGCDGETLLVALDLAGVAVSTGSACSSGSLEPSPVLLAMGYPPALARGAIRFSLWSGTTAADIDAVAALLPDVVARTRARPDRRAR